jgi:hypothetical protein
MRPPPVTPNGRRPDRDDLRCRHQRVTCPGLHRRLPRSGRQLARDMRLRSYGFRRHAAGRLDLGHQPQLRSGVAACGCKLPHAVGLACAKRGTGCGRPAEAPLASAGLGPRRSAATVGGRRVQQEHAATAENASPRPSSTPGRDLRVMGATWGFLAPRAVRPRATLRPSAHSTGTRWPRQRRTLHRRADDRTTDGCSCRCSEPACCVGHLPPTGAGSSRSESPPLQASSRSSGLATRGGSWRSRRTRARCRPRSGSSATTAPISRSSTADAGTA